MRIHPPKIPIDPNDPFKEALFSRKVFADSLTELLRNVSESLVIVVHAPWGEGKTTFASMWQADLLRQKLNVIYFDAYAADYFADPFVCFCGEILHFVKDQLPEQKGSMERSEFKKTAIEVGKRLAGLVTKIALKSATLGALEEAHIKELKDIATEIATDVAKAGSEAIEKKIENYAAEKNSLVAFREKLAKLAAVVREAQGFPLTIIVDELDRCRPDFALALLERIKHLFDVQDVAFVLLVNRDQIESYIKSVYGEVDARAYLLKFANLFVDLPYKGSEHQFQYEKGRKEDCQILFGHYELSKRVQDARFLANCLDVLVEHFRITLREIEKVFTLLTLYYSSGSKQQSMYDFLVATLSILKVQSPRLYGQLSAGQVSLEAFFAETRLDQIKKTDENLDPEWLQTALSTCLMSNAEYEKALRDEKEGKNVQVPLSDIRNWLAMERSRVIPFLCSRLDRFALKP